MIRVQNILIKSLLIWKTKEIQKVRNALGVLEVSKCGAEEKRLLRERINFGEELIINIEKEIEKEERRFRRLENRRIKKDVS